MGSLRVCSDLDPCSGDLSLKAPLPSDQRRARPRRHSQMKQAWAIWCRRLASVHDCQCFEEALGFVGCQRTKAEPGIASCRLCPFFRLSCQALPRWEKQS